MAWLDLTQQFIYNIPFKHLAYTLVLLSASVGAMMYYRLSIVGESIISFGRVFIQLVMMGGILLVFFRLNDVYLNITLCVFMVVVAGITASEQSPFSIATRVSTISQAVAAIVTLLPMTLLGVIEIRASFFIPISAMVIRNTLDRASLAFERLDNEMNQNRDLIEQYLALGIDPKTASQQVVSRSIEASMIPTLNKNKVVGLVGIPGLMTGMIVTAQPDELTLRIAEAVSLQAIILYLIFVASIFSSMMVCSWMRKKYFNDQEQIVLPRKQS